MLKVSDSESMWKSPSIPHPFCSMSKCILSPPLPMFHQISEYFWLFLSGNPLCSSGTPLKKAKASDTDKNRDYSIFFCWLCTHQHCCGALCITAEWMEVIHKYLLPELRKRDCSHGRGHRKWVNKKTLLSIQLGIHCWKCPWRQDLLYFI